MRYREYRPAPPLAGVVHRIWRLQGTGESTVAFEPAMPDGRPELVFNLGDPFERRLRVGTERQAPALLIGPTTRPMPLRPGSRIDVIGLRLCPGAWPTLLDVRGDEVVDTTVELPALSRTWRGLLDALASAPTEAVRLALLEARLRDALAGAPRRRRADPRLLAAVGIIARHGGKISTAALADATGLGGRQLGRLFRRGTGLSAGVLARVTRFQAVLRAVERPGVRWAALAHQHGYCDQAHLCREFRRFGGMSPGRYLAERRELTRSFVDAGEPLAD